ncbi:hypothetical protein KQR86_001311 [Acinetobacter baumannii]|nr:hypothetical protein [Acinetobacter baumannii]EKX6441023.1 hypothetical protein [Acinetobacter baumannii]
MKPEQFIREFGVEKAREVVEGAPDKTATHWVFRKVPNYYSVDFQSWFHDDEWWDSDCHTEQDLIDSYGENFVVNLSDLKNLIEGMDSQIALKFIKEWGIDYSEKYIALSESEGNILPWELKLKRLVESLETIESWGGIDSCRKKLSTRDECKPNATHFAIHPEKPHLIQMYRRNEPKLESNYSFAELKKAIAIHESIYGGGDA